MNTCEVFIVSPIGSTNLVEDNFYWTIARANDRLIELQQKHKNKFSIYRASLKLIPGEIEPCYWCKGVKCFVMTADVGEELTLCDVCKGAGYLVNDDYEEMLTEPE